MSIDEKILKRSEGKCELCSLADDLQTYGVEPNEGKSIDNSVLACKQCVDQINSPETIQASHFQALSTNMWSEVAAVQVMSYRVLKLLGSNPWAINLLEQLYLEDSLREWADAGLPSDEIKTVDSNGVELKQGDSVTLIKDLVVKGAGFKAKRGTVVKNISLSDDPKHVEGRVNGTRIVLVSAYLKKV